MNTDGEPLDHRELAQEAEKGVAHFDPDELRGWSRTHVIQDVVRALDAGYSLSTEQLCAMIEKYQVLPLDFDSYQEDRIPYSPNPIKKGSSILFPDGINDFDDADGLGIVLLKQISRQKIDDATRLIQTIVKTSASSQEGEMLAYLGSEVLRVNPEQADLAIDTFLKERAHNSDFQRSISGESADHDADEPVRNMDLFISKFLSELVTTVPDSLAYAISQMDDAGIDRILQDTFYDNWIIDEVDVVSALLSGARHKLQDSSLEAEKVHRLERFSRLLMGFDPDSAVEVHRTLESIYAKIPFEEYAANQDAQPHDLDEISRALAHRHGPQVVVDAGCGTGRLSNEVPLLGPECSVIAFDTSPENIVKAKEDARANGVDGVVHYAIADWEHIPAADNSVDVLYCLGRSLTHTETGKRFRSVFDEFRRVLKPDGVILFDMPDPERGRMLEARTRQIRALEARGIVIPNTSRFACLVDSPNGVDFYNRYVPGRDELDLIAHNAGYTLARVRSEPIVGYNYTPDDRNNYFTARPSSTPFDWRKSLAPSHARLNHDRAESAMV